MEEYTYGGGYLGTPEAKRIANLEGEEKEEFWAEPKRWVRNFMKWFIILGLIWPLYVLIWNLGH